MAKKANNKKTLIIIIVAVLVALVVFSCVIFKRIFIIKEQQKQKDTLSSTVSYFNEENSKISKTLENIDDENYKEEIARENGYVYPEERVYYDNDAE